MGPRRGIPGEHQRFNPLAGICCFQTEYWPESEKSAEAHERFNPLAGICCFQTESAIRGDEAAALRFNPLAGICCFQTKSRTSIRSFTLNTVSIPWRGFVVFRRLGPRGKARQRLRFQSPGGDLLFSDWPVSVTATRNELNKFQSPGGDLLFSDVQPGT